MGAADTGPCGRFREGEQCGLLLMFLPFCEDHRDDLLLGSCGARRGVPAPGRRAGLRVSWGGCRDFQTCLGVSSAARVDSMSQRLADGAHDVDARVLRRAQHVAAALLALDVHVVLTCGF